MGVTLRTTRRRVMLAGAALLGAVRITTPASTAAADPGSKKHRDANESDTFSSSFETGQPKPKESTVEEGPHGAKQRHVTGALYAPGSLLGEVHKVRASAENSPEEVATNLADAKPSTKWLAFASTGWVGYQLKHSAKVVSYSLTSANDHDERDPTKVRLQGSDDGSTWKTLDTQTGITFSKRRQTKTFSIADGGKYHRYRLKIDAVRGGDIVQLAGWDLNDGSTEQPQQPMTTAVGSGPASGYNIKARVGFTGTHALHYGGSHTADGHGYAWNRLFDVHQPVHAESVLSYRIFPELTDDDLKYPSTYVAVDLGFTDGSCLSDLAATDEHRTPAAPKGQGTGKILYADQWNAVTVRLGGVAAGKTIETILFGYDNPHASRSTRFGGWVDDVTLSATSTETDSDPVKVVDTRRGTNASSSFSRGNNLPITAMPNGFNFLTPVTDANSQSWEYSYAEHNNSDNRPQLQGLAFSHQPSPWMGDRNQLSVMPSIGSGTPTGKASDRALAFDHSTEIARPDYYRAELDGGLTVAMSPTDHGAAFRFTYPHTVERSHVVLDTVDKHGSFAVHDDGRVTGWVDNGSGLSVGRSRMFVYGVFDHHPVKNGTAPDGHRETHYLTFDTSSTHHIELRAATSFISLDQAKHNYALELRGQSFAALQSAAHKAWHERLSVLSVKGANRSDEVSLYSNLYRLNLYPNSQFENTGTGAKPQYRYASPVAAKSGSASATKTNAQVKDGMIYVNNGFWDTYRTVWSAYALLYPKIAARLADGFVQQYRDGGWIARWSSPGYADLMTGTSSDAAFAELYAKGVTLTDPVATYDAALKNATTKPTDKAVGRKGLDSSIFRGYTSDDTGESVSWELEGDINDFAIGFMAKKLARDPKTPKSRRRQLKEESHYFLNRSTAYVNLFNSKVGFFTSRKSDGGFPKTFDPTKWGSAFTEASGWNFAFHAPHDGNGLANLFGGRKKLSDKLDKFFATPELADSSGIHEALEARAVRMGQLGQSNQVSHHIAYMYTYTDKPWKTAEKVREIMRRLYVGSEIGQGYPGDEDNGEMSAWYILSALGIYPLRIGSSGWVIGSPKFTRLTVRRRDGDLVVDAPDNSEHNIYVQRVKVNGNNHPSMSIEQHDLTGDTRIEFSMGSEPSRFGVRAKDAPPSLTTDDHLGTPAHDVTGGSAGTASATGLADGSDAKALFDDSTKASAKFNTRTPTISYRLEKARQRVSMYTLTSGSDDGDPTSWILQGSRDGKSWTNLDRRHDESFPWRKQTRPFTIDRPGVYSHYRLVVHHATDKVQLAQIQLLSTDDRPHRR